MDPFGKWGGGRRTQLWAFSKKQCGDWISRQDCKERQADQHHQGTVLSTVGIWIKLGVDGPRRSLVDGLFTG